MAEQVFAGIDLAWNTNAATGIAVVDDTGVLLDSATLHTDDQIIAWMSRPDWQPVTSAVDAPLIVTNATGQRTCERMISQAFGRYNASCHTSNLGAAYFNPPRGATLAERLGWNLDPTHAGTAAKPGCIEVYPHPAMVALFQLGSVLPYKAKSGRTVDFRRSAFVELLDQMETLPHLQLTDNLRWACLRQAVIAASRQVELERIEDEIDAIFCAHLAWLWHHDRDSLQIYGDTFSGYIVAPPPPTHAAAKPVTTPKADDADQARRIAFDITARPATYATAGEAGWKAAVAEAVGSAMLGQLPMIGRFGVRIDFRLPPARNGNEAWDIDNLIKPTLDAMAGVLGDRPVRGRPQADDERIDEIHATKRTVMLGEEGASIVVSLMRDDAKPSIKSGTT